MGTKELFTALKYDGSLPIKFDKKGIIPFRLTKWLTYEGLNEDGVDEFCLCEEGYYPVYLLEDEVKAFIKKNKKELAKAYEEYLNR